MNNLWVKQSIQNARFGFARHLVIFIIAFILVATRRPEALFHAQFWAEDGSILYADAYNLGWFHALFRTYSGYFLLLPRLAAAIALLVPLIHAPLVLNLIAIAEYVLPVNILLSSRCAGWGSMRFRILLAASYVGFPITPEVRGIATNLQWILVLGALFIVLGALPRNLGERAFDIVLLLFSGLTGPFCFFLLPISVFILFRTRERWRWISVCIFAASSVVQACALLFLNQKPRGGGPLGATPALFVRILAGNVFLNPLIGGRPVAILPGTAAFVFLLVMGVAGIILSVTLFLRTGKETKLLCFLAAFILAASLISPTTAAPPGMTRWQILAQGFWLRYWFLPALAFVSLLIDGTQSRSRFLKPISMTLMLFFALSVVFQWEHPMFRELNFAGQVKVFEASPAGATVTIPENPDGWGLSLIKRPSH